MHVIIVIAICSMSLVALLVRNFDFILYYFYFINFNQTNVV